jgi:sulfur carrier protein ThiS adenylyltransferase
MNDPSTTIANRDVRQRGLVPPERLAECEAVVIGVGAIGRQVAIQLSSLGVPRLALYDDDLVQVENLASQGYWPENLQSLKVNATAELCRRIHPQIQVKAVPERFKRSTARSLPMEGSLVIVCCVDSIVTRRLIWETIRPMAQLFIDGRMNAEVLRVITVDEPAVDDTYQGTLFGAEEAFTGPCTARSTIYTASIVAGLMVHQFTKWLRGIPVDRDVTLNLLAAELIVSERR